MIVDKFLEWMESAPAGKRAEATSALARACLYSKLEPIEKEAAISALTVLLDDASPMVRMALADALSGSSDAPRHLVLGLASDQPTVASIVLERSPLFMDSELVEIVASGEETCQCAISRRFRLSASTCAALAEVGCEEACLAMLDNSGATIASFSMRRIADRHGEKSRVRNRLLAIPELPVDVRQQLILQLGSALGELAVVKSWLPGERRSLVVREACEKATVEMARVTDVNELIALVEHLRISKQLTGELLLRALCMGNMVFFETALISLSGLPAKRVSALLRAEISPPLLALCKKTGIPERVVPAILAAIDAHRQVSAELDRDNNPALFARRMMDRVVSVYSESGHAHHVDDLLALLRRFATDATRDDAREVMRSRQKVAA